MKNNREFLEGVYKKAEVLEREKARKNLIYKNLVRYSSVAAIFIILPLLIFNNQLFGPKSNIKTPPEPRIMIANEPNSNFTEANYILIGTIQNVNEDKINIIINDILYGDLDENEIQLNINNEIIEVSSKRSLFFLNKDEDNKYYLVNGSDGQFIEIERDIFVDNYGNEYTLERIKDNIQEMEK